MTPNDRLVRARVGVKAEASLQNYRRYRHKWVDIRGYRGLPEVERLRATALFYRAQWDALADCLRDTDVEVLSVR